MVMYSKEDQNRRKYFCKVVSCYEEINKGDKFCEIHKKKIFGRSSSIKSNSPNSYPKALKNAKTQFQRLRRVQCANEMGKVLCVDFIWRQWNRVDAGHYYPAKRLNTCFEDMNVWPQAKVQNMDMNNPTVLGKYTKWMKSKFSDEELKLLEFRSLQPASYSKDQLNMMAKAFKKKADRLINIKGL